MDDVSRLRLLFVDAYDSFAYNIVTLLRDSLDADVTFTTIDDNRFLSAGHEDFVHSIHQWHAIVVGPGPGDPRKSKDIGWVDRLWRLKDSDVVPVLGICLGFQSLCLAFGAQIQRLTEPKHGLVGPITVKADSFLALDNTPEASHLEITHYHSLKVHIYVEPSVSESSPWQPSSQCPNLLPLAWDLRDQSNGPVLEAVQHSNLPFWAVQFHPESICSQRGPGLIRNWWKEALRWRLKLRTPLHDLVHQCSTTLPCNGQDDTKSNGATSSRSVTDLFDCLRLNISQSVESTKLPFKGAVIDLVGQLRDFTNNETILLQSGTAKDGSILYPDTGRYTIIAIVDDNTPKLLYHLKTKELMILQASKALVTTRVTEIWDYLKEWIKYMRVEHGSAEVPFWGGLMGYVTYEAGLETSLGLEADSLPSKLSEMRPDLIFACVTRCLVIDHLRAVLYVQSIREGDNTKWLPSVSTKIQIAIKSLSSAGCEPSSDAATACSRDKKPDQNGVCTSDCIESSSKTRRVTKPSRKDYFSKLKICDEEIRAGNSYELCLTDQTHISVTKDTKAASVGWHLYRNLIRRNNSPFSAFIRLRTPKNGVTVASSSPERFLSWNRRGLCEFRPIKGTVRKTAEMTLEKATAILSTSKEKAENLMIADLIRHDLNSVPGIQNVRVPGLFRIEEYASVYQLVSVIQGDLPRDPSKEAIEKPDPEKIDYATGIDVLRRSLPPGSMTGAPKLRSCQILQNLEQKPRGIYSGVIGYLDCGGGGDFSVVIRTAWHWDDDVKTDEETGEEMEVWSVGAGGAVTAQSSLQGEWDEMCTKANSVLSAFGTELC